MVQTVKIIGPPGTGKTTHLIKNVVYKELESGVDPHKIGYYSFTKTAASEAKKRVIEAFPWYEPGDFPHFRTLHSQCFKELGLSRDRVMTGENLKKFGEYFRYEFSVEDEKKKQNEDESDHKEVALKTLGDYLLFFHTWRRNLMLDIGRAYSKFMYENEHSIPHGFNIDTISVFESRYEQYKKENELYDFVDMIELTIEHGIRLNLDVIIKDEAQDSSPLLYKLLDHFNQNGVKRCYIAGDPDQAIFEWQGAAPHLMQSYECDERILLDQSWRLPMRVHRLAKKILHTVDYYPRDETGLVEDLHLGAFLRDINNYEGSQFILNRNRYLLEPVTDMLYSFGVPFENLRGDSMFRGDARKRLVTLRKFLRYDAVKAEDLYSVLKMIPQKDNLKRGFKHNVEIQARENPYSWIRLSQVRENITDRFLADPYYYLKIKPKKLAFLLNYIENHGEENLISDASCTIGTIHSFKGMEADWVVISPEMSRNTWYGSQKLREAERRVWYTAVTRARKGVILIPPRGQYYWEFPFI